MNSQIDHFYWIIISEKETSFNKLQSKQLLLQNEYIHLQD